jgi:predicted  nucleic acid-binding Zn-ribbon protein
VKASRSKGRRLNMEEAKGKVDGEVTNASELDDLKRGNEMLKSELKTKAAAIAELEKAAAEKDKETVALKQSLEESARQLEETRNSSQQALAAYKELAVQANPGLVAEMIKGESIAAIDESIKNARALVERVKQEMAAESARVRVPAGAPQRMPPDLSALSPREKIKYGMEGG